MSQLNLAFHQPTYVALPGGALITGVAGTPNAAWPVWRDSTRRQVKYAPLPRKKAVKLFHDARRFERVTRTPGRQDGALGRNGLAVLHALIFDFLNYATGALFPSHQTIARAANISPRSVARGLAKLKAAGVVNWLRRCAEDWIDGRFVLRQESNAYALLPPSQWRGFTPEAETPKPPPEVWGAAPPLPSPIEAAASEANHRARIDTLNADPSDALALALARLGRLIASDG